METVIKMLEKLEILKIEEEKLKKLVLFFFFISGSCALIYEIIWMRWFSLLFGSTIYAVTAVLSSFMAGLALGSYFIGKASKSQKNPLKHLLTLKTYAMLELGVGIYALLMPLIIKAIYPVMGLAYQSGDPNFYFIVGLKFVLSFLAMVVPTFLMGGTLPVLSKFFITDSQTTGNKAGKLYGLNTMGGVIGCVSVPFILIPILGLTKSVVFAGVLNIAIAIIVLLVSHKQKEKVLSYSAETEFPLKANDTVTKPVLAIVGVGFALSGMIAMFYEVLWTRVLIMIVGTSVYAFALVLAGFLSGIAIGAYFISRFSDRIKRPVFVLGWLEILIGFTSLIFIILVEPGIYSYVKIAQKTIMSFYIFSFLQFALVFLMMMIPTVLFGAIFPIVFRIFSSNTESVGWQIGRIYSYNTIGCIAGPIIASFILIPVIGIQNSLKLAFIINVLIGIVFIFIQAKKIKNVYVQSAVVIVMTITALFVSPKWDLGMLNYAPYYSFGTISGIKDFSGLKKVVANDKVLYYKESIDSNILVKYNERKKVKSMHINGKPDASNSIDMITQILLAQVPLLLHREPKSVFVIGMGGGDTVRTTLRHPVKSVKCVEICEDAVNAAMFFERKDFSLKNDKRLRIIIDDARTYLQFDENRYDVIISEPSNPWVRGASNLFTKEFLTLCRDRLEAEGIICQWINSYEVPPNIFKVFLKTFSDVFPDSSVWVFSEGDVLVIGKMEPLIVDYELLKKKLENERIRNVARMFRPNARFNYFVGYMMGREEVKKFVERAEENNDDNTLIERELPKYKWMATYLLVFAEMCNFNKLAVLPVINLQRNENGHVAYDYMNIRTKINQTRWQKLFEGIGLRRIFDFDIQEGMFNVKNKQIECERNVVYKSQNRMFSITAIQRENTSGLNEVVAFIKEDIKGETVKYREIEYNGHKAFAVFSKISDKIKMFHTGWYCDKNKFIYIVTLTLENVKEEEFKQSVDEVFENIFCDHEGKRPEFL